MQRYAFMALVALVASPVLASADKGDLARPNGNAVDKLYPEIAVDDDGWRGLLPVILINPEEVSEQPRPAEAPGRRSERSQDR